MIAKKYKLPINLFPKTARTIFRDEFAVLKSAPNGLDFNRLGVILRARDFKTAVLRNRLRRAAFDFFRTESKLFAPRASQNAAFDLLIILNPPIIGLTKEKIKDLFKNYGRFI